MLCESCVNFKLLRCSFPSSFLMLMLIHIYVKYQVTDLVNLNVDSLSAEEAMARFYQEASSPVQGVCYSLKRIGGRWRPENKVAEIDLEKWSRKAKCVQINILRPSMEINLSAWTLTPPKTALSILLVLGSYNTVL